MEKCYFCKNECDFENREVGGSRETFIYYMCHNCYSKLYYLGGYGYVTSLLLAKNEEQLQYIIKKYNKKFKKTIDKLK